MPIVTSAAADDNRTKDLNSSDAVLGQGGALLPSGVRMPPLSLVRFFDERMVLGPWDDLAIGDGGSPDPRRESFPGQAAIATRPEGELPLRFRARRARV